MTRDTGHVTRDDPRVRILQMSGISNKVSTILWISCGVNAINFFASFIGEAACPRVSSRVVACPRVSPP